MMQFVGGSIMLPFCLENYPFMARTFLPTQVQIYPAFDLV